MSVPFTPSVLGDTQWEWRASDVFLAALCAAPSYLHALGGNTAARLASAPPTPLRQETWAWPITGFLAVT